MVGNAPRRAAGLTIHALAVFLVGCSGGTPFVVNPGPTPTGDTTPPTVPGGVVATAQTSTSIVVTWTASTDAGAGVAGYRVYRNGSATALASVSLTTYTDSSVSANTQYSYTVRAY